MTSFTTTWDSSYNADPADSGDAQDGAAKIRVLKEAIQARMDVEHYMGLSDGADQGIHKFPNGNTSARSSINGGAKTGRIYLNTEHNTLDFYDGSAWNVVGVPAGAKMLFYASTAPVGWTQDTSVNDKVVRVVSSGGAATGGSWTISGVTVDGHTLTAGEIPSHTHSVSGTTGSDGSHTHTAQSAGAHTHTQQVRTTAGGAQSHPDPGTKGESPTDLGATSSDGAHTHTTDSQGAHTHSFSATSGSAGSGGSHTHGLTADGAWRPAYADYIVCTKD